MHALTLEFPFHVMKFARCSRMIAHRREIKNVGSFCRQKGKEVIICGRAHLPNNKIPLSRASGLFLLSSTIALMVAVLRPEECLVTLLSFSFRRPLAVGRNYVSRERGVARPQPYQNNNGHATLSCVSFCCRLSQPVSSTPFALFPSGLLSYLPKYKYLQTAHYVHQRVFNRDAI